MGYQSIKQGLIVDYREQIVRAVFFLGLRYTNPVLKE